MRTKEGEAIYRVDLDGDKIILRAPEKSDTVVKQIPGARWDRERRLWTLPLSWASCVVARGVIGRELEVGPKLAEWAKTEKERRVDPALRLRDAQDLPDGWRAFFDRVEGGAV